VATTSPAMDIQVPYNIERILYLLTEASGESNEEKKTKYVRESMIEMESKGTFTAPPAIMETLRRVGIRAVQVNQTIVKATIASAWKKGRLTSITLAPLSSPLAYISLSHDDTK
jgi:threonine synthase